MSDVWSWTQKVSVWGSGTRSRHPLAAAPFHLYRFAIACRSPHSAPPDMITQTPGKHGSPAVVCNVPTRFRFLIGLGVSNWQMRREHRAEVSCCLHPDADL
jgi:hypothetical protein